MWKSNHINSCTRIFARCELVRTLVLGSLLGANSFALLFECVEATLLNIAHSLTMVAWTCSLATHVAAVTLEVILRKSLGQDVCRLVFGANGEDLD